MARGFVFTFEALVCLLLVAGLVFFFSFSSFDSKKDFYRKQLAEDFAEASVKSNAFALVKRFDVNALKAFYSLAGQQAGVSCIGFGFEHPEEVGCSKEHAFFSASRSVFADGKWKSFSVVLGFD